MARTHDAPRALGVVAVTAVLTWLLSAVRVPVLALDSLTPGEASAALSALAPAVMAVAIVAVLADPYPELDAVSSRPARWLRSLALTFAVIASAAALSLASLASTGSVDGVPLRNLLGFTGLALLTATLAGARASWAGPTVLLIAVIGFGVDSSLEPRAWAWPLHAAGSPAAAATVTALFAAGAVAVVLRGTAAPTPE